MDSSVCVCEYTNVFQIGMIAGVVFLIILDGLVSCVRGLRLSVFGSRANSLIVSGNLDSSIVQSNGRLWIDGKEVGTGAAFQTSCTKSLRITADGEVLNTQLQPDMPIYLRVDPGVVIKNLEAGTSLNIEGNIENCTRLHAGTSTRITGTVAAKDIDAGTSIYVNGNLSCTKADAGTSISVTGDAYSDRFDASTGISVGGQRRRRISLY